MNRLRQVIRNYFGFSKSETNGFIVLVPLMFLILFSPAFYGAVFSKSYDPNDGDQQMLDSVLGVWNQRVEEALEKNREPEIEINLRAFNPNQSSELELKTLGIPAFLAGRIIRYREKGGEFRIKSDLARIYDFPDSLYQELHPYISLPAKLPSKRSNVVQVKSKPIEKQEEIEFIAASHEPPLYINLNTADTTELKQLRGIGSGYSRRIVKYRQLLGGFTNKQQLNEVYGISDSLYMSLETQIYVESPSPQKLNVNIANFKALNKHPYISYKQAGSILNTRSKKGKFRSPSDLLVVEGLDSALIQRLTPYITF